MHSSLNTTNHVVSQTDFWPNGHTHTHTHTHIIIPVVHLYMDVHFHLVAVAAKTLTAVVHGKLGELPPIPFSISYPNGCDTEHSNVTCPLTVGKQYHYTATVPIPSIAPSVSQIFSPPCLDGLLLIMVSVQFSWLINFLFNFRLES